MRAVATRLEAVPMAIYNHFATKEQLVDALLDRVLSRFEPPPPTDDWIEDLRRFAGAHRRLLVAMRGLSLRSSPSPIPGSAPSASASTSSASCGAAGSRTTEPSPRSAA